MLVVLGLNSVGGNIGSHQVCRLENRRQVEQSSLGCSERFVDAKLVGSTNHLVDGSETEFGHDGSQFFDDVVEEVDDLLGLTGELGSESGVLGSDTDRAGVPACQLDSRLATKGLTCDRPSS